MRSSVIRTPRVSRQPTDPNTLSAGEEGPDGGLVGMALGVLQEGVEATKKGESSSRSANAASIYTLAEHEIVPYSAEKGRPAVPPRKIPHQARKIPQCFLDVFHVQNSDAAAVQSMNATR